MNNDVSWALASVELNWISSLPPRRTPVFSLGMGCCQLWHMGILLRDRALTAGFGGCNTCLAPGPGNPCYATGLWHSSFNWMHTCHCILCTAVNKIKPEMLERINGKCGIINILVKHFIHYLSSPPWWYFRMAICPSFGGGASQTNPALPLFVCLC